ncbi:MAG: hypothetical protein H8D43_03640 [Chloroflexi bacterium]|nr:hypothetical protein [Chloroflexota bacterium]MBL7189117.1 hypothetical protein [Phycisphaerae bacterium]
MERKRKAKRYLAKATHHFAKPALSKRASVHPLQYYHHTLGNQGVGRFIQARLRAGGDEQPGPTRNRQRSDALGNQNAAELHIAAAPQESQAPPPAAPAASPPAYVHPLTAVALIARMQSESCKIPKGQHGVSKIVQFGIFDFNGRRVRDNFTVNEQFTLRKGPQSVFQSLKPNAAKAQRGRFDDCYRLYQPSPLPGDLRLEVEQNHLINGRTVSKNYVTYTSNGISVCVFPRASQQKDFGTRCKRF